MKNSFVNIILRKEFKTEELIPSAKKTLEFLNRFLLRLDLGWTKGMVQREGRK